MNIPSFLNEQKVRFIIHNLTVKLFWSTRIIKVLSALQISMNAQIKMADALTGAQTLIVASPALAQTPN